MVMNGGYQGNASTDTTAMPPAVLELEGFGLGYANRIVLSEVDLRVPRRGLTILLGPGGAGKSSLVRTLCGISDGIPSRVTWGTVRYLGEPLGVGPLPQLVAQNARLMMARVLENLLLHFPDRASKTLGEQKVIAREMLSVNQLDHLADHLDASVVDLPLGWQRQVAIARTASLDPALLCLDEPTAGLDDHETALLLAQMTREAERRSVLFITHNQRHARGLSGHAILMAGGRVIAHESVEDFFERPKTPILQHFVATGGCSLPSPDTKPEDLADGEPAPPPPPAEALERLAQPRPNLRGFHWLEQRILAGMPKPGLIEDLDHDLAQLEQLRVTHLVCLTHEPTAAEDLAKFGITGLHFFIEDMKAPEIKAALTFCEFVNELIKAGAVVAYHCHGGLGRTGTMLATHKILEGQSALAALENIRAIEPKWVQSTEQLDFLAAVDRHLHSSTREEAFLESEHDALG